MRWHFLTRLVGSIQNHYACSSAAFLFLFFGATQQQCVHTCDPPLHFFWFFLATKWASRSTLDRWWAKLSPFLSTTFVVIIITNQTLKGNHSDNMRQHLTWIWWWIVVQLFEHDEILVYFKNIPRKRKDFPYFALGLVVDKKVNGRGLSLSLSPFLPFLCWKVNKAVNHH